MCLRVNTLSKLIPYTARRFIGNLPAIFVEMSNHALLGDASECSDLLKLYKNVAIGHVLSYPDVEQPELQGYRITSGLLEIHHLLLNLPLSDLTELVEKGRVKRFPIGTRLFHRFSTRHRLAYVEAVSKLLPDFPEFPLWEYCYRCRLLQGYISGITDFYAWDEYRRLMAVGQ